MWAVRCRAKYGHDLSECSSASISGVRYISKRNRLLPISHNELRQAKKVMVASDVAVRRRTVTLYPLSDRDLSHPFAIACYYWLTGCVVRGAICLLYSRWQIQLSLHFWGRFSASSLTFGMVILYTMVSKSTMQFMPRH